MRILLLGSCVTRDAFEFQPEAKPFELIEYFARSTLNSATDSKPFTGVDVERIESPFQKRIVTYDLTGGFLKRLRRNDFDLLILDAIDERFDTVRNPAGAVATRSTEFNRTGYDPSGDSIIRSNSAEAIAHWQIGWTRLLTELTAIGRLPDLRINRAWWADRMENGGEFPEVFTSKRIAEANEYLANIYDRAGRDISPRQFYDFKDGDIVGATIHRWGPSPFHYAHPYYESLLAHLMSDSSTTS